jgi:hypothetical protein
VRPRSGEDVPTRWPSHANLTSTPLGVFSCRNRALEGIEGELGPGGRWRERMVEEGPATWCLGADASVGGARRSPW